MISAPEAKLSAGLGARGFEHKMWECFAVTSMSTIKLIGGSGNGTETGQKRVRGVAVQRRVGSAVGKRPCVSGRHSGPKCDGGWERERLAGAVCGWRDQSSDGGEAAGVPF